MFDGKAFGEEIVGIVREYVDKEVAPLKAENAELKSRIAALEAVEMPEVVKGDPGEPGKDGRDGADGKDGAGIIDAFISRDGHLIASLSNGTTKDLGEIVGKDGRDGEKGADGKDGFNLEDFEEFVAEDDRTIVRRMKSGEYEYESRLKFPTQIYRGVFKDGQQYERGDTVTWAGCQWHCDKDTTEKPGTEDWTMCVKKGRDGKDAKPNG